MFWVWYFALIVWSSCLEFVIVYCLMVGDCCLPFSFGLFGAFALLLGLFVGTCFGIRLSILLSWCCCKYLIWVC